MGKIKKAISAVKKLTGKGGGALRQKAGKVVENKIKSQAKKAVKKKAFKLSDYKKQSWRFELEHQAKGSISDSRREAMLADAQKKTFNALNRLVRSGYGQGEYYDDLREWLSVIPRNKKEEREKLYVLQNFLSDDDVRTVAGIKRTFKERAEFVDEMREKQNKRYDTNVALSFLAWRFGVTGKKVSYADLGDKEEIAKELWDWKRSGCPTDVGGGKTKRKREKALLNG